MQLLKTENVNFTLLKYLTIYFLHFLLNQQYFQLQVHFDKVKISRKMNILFHLVHQVPHIAI